MPPSRAFGTAVWHPTQTAPAVAGGPKLRTLPGKGGPGGVAHRVAPQLAGPHVPSDSALRNRWGNGGGLHCVVCVYIYIYGLVVLGLTGVSVWVWVLDDDFRVFVVV